MDDPTSHQPQPSPILPQPESPVPNPQFQPQVDPVIKPLPAPIREDIFVPPFSTATTPPKKSKKRLVMIIAAILIVLGGGVSVYAFWYQNPEKVITDGVIHAIQAKSLEYTGSVNVDTGSYKMKLELTGADLSNAHRVGVKLTMPGFVDSKDMVIEGDGMFDANSNLYVKVKNVDQILASYRSLFSVTVQKTFDQVVAKVNNKWIKITAADMVGLSGEASKVQTCSGDAIKKYANDAAAISQIADVYKNNRFVVIDQNLGTKNGSLGYTVKTDDSKAKAFAEGLKTTKIYMALHDCDSSFTVSSDDIAPSTNADSTVRAEIWVSQWTHQITKIVTAATQKEESSISKADAVFEPRFNTGVTIQAPEASTTLAQLKTDMEKLIQDAQQEQTTVL